jgi:hypothetical protein
MAQSNTNTNYHVPIGDQILQHDKVGGRLAIKTWQSRGHGARQGQCPDWLTSKSQVAETFFASLLVHGQNGATANMMETG